MQDKGQIQKLVKDFKVSKQNKLIYTAQNIEDYSDPKLIRAIIYKIVISKKFKDSKYIRNILNLKYISPDLTEQILTGTQPENLSLQKLIVNIY